MHNISILIMIWISVCGAWTHFVIMYLSVVSWWVQCVRFIGIMCCTTPLTFPFGGQRPSLSTLLLLITVWLKFSSSFKFLSATTAVITRGGFHRSMSSFSSRRSVRQEEALISFSHVSGTISFSGESRNPPLSAPRSLMIVLTVNVTLEFNVNTYLQLHI